MQWFRALIFTVEGTEAHRGGRTHSGLCYSEQPGQDLNTGLSVSRATVLTVGFFFFSAIHLHCWDLTQGLTHRRQLFSH